jgi:formylglycine-generating enzyme required for sulfatase activity
MSLDLRALPLGKVISGYRIERVLGQGGFGITYLATDVNLERKVAVKEYFPRDFAVRSSTLKISAAGNQSDQETFDWGLRRFLKEAQLLARFEHPNIIAVRRFFEANGTAYLVMDYCEGKPLDEIIKKNGPLDQDQLKRIWFPLLNGLEQIHSSGFLHRDIKPQNIFIRFDGSPVLLDFGSAIKGNAQHEGGVTTMVTDGYSPVEQYDTNGKQGPFTDIYGLGATLYRAITGDKPQASTGRILNDSLLPLVIKLRGKFDENLLGAIDTSMSVRPEKRPQDIAEWRTIIGKKLSSSSFEKRTPVSERSENLVKKSATSHTSKKKLPQTTLPPQNLATHEYVSDKHDLPKSEKILKKNWSTSWVAIGTIFLTAILLGLFFTGQFSQSNNTNLDSQKTQEIFISATPKVELNEIRDCDACPVMALIPGGTFSMGTADGEIGKSDYETPKHNVTLEPFYVGKFEITNKEWNSCVQAKRCQDKVGSEGKNSEDLPISNVTWYDAQAYISWISKKTGKDYQLLTESQWEYAARAGSKSAYYFGAEPGSLGQYSWSESNADGVKHPVGLKQANSLELFDMYGNVSEWTADCWNESYLNAPINGSSWIEGNCSARVIRGGGFEDSPTSQRSASRSFGILDFRSLNLGFRVARKVE